MRGETEIKLSCLFAIRHAVEKRGSSLFSLHVCVSVISVCHPPGMGGWEDEGMEGEATKGCKLIRFLSLHAPLPVLLLSNPGGQRYTAQRLDSQTQWGNNWYKQHLAAETLSVTPSDTFSPLSPLILLSKCFQSDSKALYSLLRSFLHPSVLSELLLGFHILSFTEITAFSVFMPFPLKVSSSLLISPSSTSSCLCLILFCVYQLNENVFPLQNRSLYC